MENKTAILLRVFLILSPFFIVKEYTFAQVIDTSRSKFQPKLVQLNLDSSTYQRILGGTPDAVTMHSGLVTLKPGETVGEHNTNDYEEILVIFSGEGQMIFEDGKTFNLKYGEVAYCPPHTKHDVKNTGTTFLKYVYIAAKTKQ
jgi:quercetin dioxygenase-like cupin family protein